MNSSPDPPARFKPRNWHQSVNCAIEGLLWAVRSQRNLRFHLAAATLVMVLALWLRVNTLEFILLTLAITLVLFAELFNTAIEVVVDLVSPDYHPLAQRAKDVAAAAVLMACIGAVLLGYLAFSSHLFPPVQQSLSLLAPPSGALALAALGVVTLLVVLIKAITGRGTPLHGGMPSGHSAIAFAIATAVSLAGIGPVSILLVVALAAMVSHSRLLMEIHTLGEVLAGMLLGVGVTLLLYLLFH